MNPALAARCFLLLSFSSQMTAFTYDSVTGATPLKVIRDTGDFDLYNMFLGLTAGTIGETSVLAILLGALYLVCKKIIDIRIPLAYLGSFSLFILIFGEKMFDIHYLALQLCGGGLMLGAFFMATDYVTSPITRSGKWIFGLMLGILTGIFRLFGPNAEGVSFAIIFCNLLVPLIEKITMKKHSFKFLKKKEVKHE
jgi:electron transport complex protein RnfD/electron transport complex protein RnfC